MPLTKTNVELSYLNVVTGTPVVVDIPAFANVEIYVKYGEGKLFAQEGLDYLIALDEPVPIPPPTTQFYQFVTITPTASLLAKIATDGTNIMYVGRKLALTTEFSELDAFTRANIDVEFARTNMKLQQLEASNVIGNVPDPRNGNAFDFIRVNADKSGYEFVVLPGGGDMLKINNLSDVVDKPASLANIGGQPRNNRLDAISALDASVGFVVHNGVDTFNKRILVQGTGITLTNADGQGGNVTVAVTGGTYQGLDNTLTALGGMDATPGFVVETSFDVFTKRSIAVTAGGGVTVSNSAGTAGNPTLAVDVAFSPTWTGVHVFGDGTGQRYIQLAGAAGQERGFIFRSGAAGVGTTTRWKMVLDAAAESGGNAGSTFYIQALSDTGAFLNSPIIITRATGQVSFASGGGIVVPVGGLVYGGTDILARNNTWTNAQTVQYAGATVNVTATSANAFFGVSATAGASFIRIGGPAGQFRMLQFTTGTLDRWRVYADLGAEGGSNAGSDFYVQRYDDLGAFLGNALIIKRDTGDFATDIEIDKAAPILRVHSSANNNNIGYIEQLNHRSDGNTSFFGRYAAGMRRTDGTTIIATQVVGMIAFGGQWGTDTAYTPAKILYAASISGVAEGSYTAAGAMPTGLAFRTGVVGDSLLGPNLFYGTEYMRLASDGGFYSIGVTGGSKGVGTANFATLYEGGTSLVAKYQAIFAAGQTPATATNDNAAAGKQGEYMSVSITGASQVNITTTAVAQNFGSLALTAGDWEISANVQFVPDATTNLTEILACFSTVSATISTIVGCMYLRSNAGYVPGATEQTAVLPPLRISLAAPTTYFLVVRGRFTVSFLHFYGIFSARRIR